MVVLRAVRRVRILGMVMVTCVQKVLEEIQRSRQNWKIKTT